MLGPIIKVVFNLSNPFKFIDLVTQHGDNEDGIRLITYIREHRVVDKSTWPTILAKVRTAMVPRLPDLQQDLLDLLVQLFGQEPSLYYKELLLITKSEDDLKKILRVIEDNTAFDIPWTTDLKAIVYALCKQCKCFSPLNLLPRSMKIVVENFKMDPQSWGFHLFEFGTAGDIKMGCKAIEDYIRDKNTDKLMSSIKRFITESTKKWPEVVPDVCRMLPHYFEKTRLNADHYASFFSYPFWRSNHDCFMLCLRNQWRILKDMLPDDKLSICEALAKSVMVATTFKLNVAARSLINSVTNGLKNNIEAAETQQTSWRRNAALVPNCCDNTNLARLRGLRCDGCLQLVDFLGNETSAQRNITVNQAGRSCITRILKSYVATGNGERTILSTAVNVRFNELNWGTNMSQFGSRHCGCILVTKIEESTKSPQAEIAR
jgi:hypothetical protein